MNTWPISLYRDGTFGCLGVPDRLGHSGTYRELTAPSLEEVVGDHWAAEVLARMLPDDRTFAWWVPTNTLRRSGMPTDPAAAVVDLRTLSAPIARRFLWNGASLAVVPAGVEGKRLREWAGSDSEQAEHVWIAPADLELWDTNVIATWCRDRERWSEARSVAEQPAEQILTAFDGHFFLAGGPELVIRVRDALATLAQSWNLQVAEGEPQFAWVESPVG